MKRIFIQDEKLACTAPDRKSWDEVVYRGPALDGTDRHVVLVNGYDTVVEDWQLQELTPKVEAGAGGHLMVTRAFSALNIALCDHRVAAICGDRDELDRTESDIRTYTWLLSGTHLNAARAELFYRQRNAGGLDLDQDMERARVRGLNRLAIRAGVPSELLGVAA